ncbi:IclR family transcriptional regulator [Halobellus captivus]|uniref:IclR family transcriptional regulator n=1 Tax=Halobellus captivus TaxID=2592614 RepID=UPI0011A1AAC5|nr:IclR family transcriptional regulator [Halobellus captivus]
MNKDSEGSRTVKSDETLISIIELLLEKNQAGVSELSSELGLSPSAVYAHLYTLQKYELVVSDAGVYELSLRFLEFGNKIRKKKQLYSAAQEPMEVFTEEIQEQVWCAILEQDKIAFCATSSRDRTASQPVEIGSRLYMHRTSIGKSILAELQRDVAESIIDQSGLPKKTENTITDRTALFEELDQIREQGYALNLEERIEGINSIGTSINDPSGRPIGGISIVGAANRLTEEICRSDYSQNLIGTADEIELKLKYK